MKIVINKQTKIVSVMDFNCSFNGRGKLIKPFNAPMINDVDYEILEVTSPELFISGAMKYENNIWTIINQTAYDEAYSVFLKEKKDTKCQGIDSRTKQSIITLAGSLESQSNKQAKSSQLIRKESLGTITTEEKALLEYLDDLFVQIEVIINDGNAKEVEIQDCVSVEAVEALGY